VNKWQEKQNTDNRRNENSKILKSILIIFGLIGVIVGVEMFFMPVTFSVTSGIDLGNNISWLN